MRTCSFGFESPEERASEGMILEYCSQEEQLDEVSSKPANYYCLDQCTPRISHNLNLSRFDWTVDFMDISRPESGENGAETTGNTNEVEDERESSAVKQKLLPTIPRKKQNYRVRKTHGKGPKPPRSEHLETKNILRNMGIAQNQYILHNKRAKKLVVQSGADPIEFMNWVRTVRPQNFVEFRLLWNTPNSPFHVLYRRLCLSFYCQDAVPYILRSRLQKSQKAHLTYLFRFMKGALNPECFTHFK